MPRISAARVKFNSVATATKYLRCRSSKFKTTYRVVFIYWTDSNAPPTILGNPCINIIPGDIHHAHAPARRRPLPALHRDRFHGPLGPSALSVPAAWLRPPG